MDQTTAIEISPEELRIMKKAEREKSLAALRENQSLRGRRSPGRKSSGIVARYFHLNGKDEPPTRVLIMDPPRRSEPKNDQARMKAAAEKRVRRNIKRLDNALRREAGAWS